MFSPLKTVTANVGSVIENVRDSVPESKLEDMNPVKKIIDVAESVAETVVEPAKVIKDAVAESVEAVSDAVSNAIESIPSDAGHFHPIKKFAGLLAPLGCLNKLTYAITMDWTNFFFGLFNDIMGKVFKQVNKYLKLAGAQGT